MPLVPLRPLMEAAEAHNYAQGAFNVNAVAQAKAVIEMHETFRSPAILQGADLANAFMGGRVDFANGTLEDKKKGARNIANAVKKYGEHSPIPVVLHLDHGKDFDSCVAAIEGGYTSVMIDGSSLPLEQNIELTREVVKYAHARGVSVEGELGVLGGQEDHVFAATSTYTNPLDAVKFIQQTGVDALAISYGTQHGANKGKDAKLRREIPIAIKECINRLGIFCALVSHGSSTVPQYIVKEINDLGGDIQNAYGINVDELIAAIPCGIRKINVDTDIRLAVTRNMKELFAQQPALQNSSSIGEEVRFRSPGVLPAHHGHRPHRQCARRRRGPAHEPGGGRREGGRGLPDRQLRLLRQGSPGGAEVPGGHDRLLQEVRETPS